MAASRSFSSAPCRVLLLEQTAGEPLHRHRVLRIEFQPGFQPFACVGPILLSFVDRRQAAEDPRLDKVLSFCARVEVRQQLVGFLIQHSRFREAALAQGEVAHDQIRLGIGRGVDDRLFQGVPHPQGDVGLREQLGHDHLRGRQFGILLGGFLQEFQRTVKIAVLEPGHRIGDLLRLRREPEIASRPPAPPPTSTSPMPSTGQERLRSRLNWLNVRLIMADLPFSTGKCISLCSPARIEAGHLLSVAYS